MQRAKEHYIQKQLVGDFDDVHMIVSDGLLFSSSFFFLALQTCKGETCVC